MRNQGFNLEHVPISVRPFETRLLRHILGPVNTKSKHDRPEMYTFLDAPYSLPYHDASSIKVSEYSL